MQPFDPALAVKNFIRKSMIDARKEMGTEETEQHKSYTNQEMVL
jgi:hypothetical protein